MKRNGSKYSLFNSILYNITVAGQKEVYFVREKNFPILKSLEQDHVITLTYDRPHRMYIAKLIEGLTDSQIEELKVWYYLQS